VRKKPFRAVHQAVRETQFRDRAVGVSNFDFVAYDKMVRAMGWTLREYLRVREVESGT